ncbi:cytochrome c biogenesis protein ResB [Cellulomonas sp. URHE0023]|uniref:cytochrome c biogenesis protein ResB n=1 Tax=Cellulomonas sp. URHE0023 TaxID=1380354 RepID=UPI000689E728|nr:cytochrome c biogenesis protein ResB [Cellulomonas sp. URHE0023]
MSQYRPEGISDVFTEPTDPGEQRPVVQGIGLTGWLRWAWRQLTSMRVALLLLMLLAVAAVPGTVWPQRAQSPEKVVAYLTDHPSLGPVLDRVGAFNVYSSVWFSAIYLLLFVSLVGCILPRTKVHLAGVRGRPPRAPRRFGRFPAQGSGTADDTPEELTRRATAVLRRGWRLLPFVPTYRVETRDEGDGTWSVAGERGYLRETGNLVFHLALVGLLISVATGQVLHYRGQMIVVQGSGFANSQGAYDTFERGTAYSPSSLVPFTLALDDFESRFDPETLASRDFTAHVTLTEPGEKPQAETIKVNHPLDAGGAKVYLQGNGYAPDLTIHDASGALVSDGPTPFLPQDQVYTSKGVVKVPDVTDGQDQVGLIGFLLPTKKTVETPNGPAYVSQFPEPNDPVLVLNVWKGNLGLDTGVPQNVYELDEARMTQVKDADGDPVILVVKPGETVELPDGLGTLTFNGLKRFVALDLRHDPALVYVLVFALLAFAGLATSLFAPRRRVWLRFTPAHDEGDDRSSRRTVVTAAGLARGDDVGLQPELDRVLAATLAQHPDGEANDGHR